MPLNVLTSDVIMLLKYAKLTAHSGKDDPLMSSIVLHTVDNQPGADSEGSTRLVATSSNGSIAGQCAVPVTGKLKKPVVVPPIDTAWMITMLSTDIRQHKGEQDSLSVNLEFDTTNNVLSMHALSGGEPSNDDRRCYAGLDVSNDYPFQSVAKILSADPDIEGSRWTRAMIPDGYLSILASATRMSPVEVSLYQTTDPNSSTVVALLPHWRGVFPAVARHDSGDIISAQEWKLPS